ncbi:glutathione S-transferase Y-2 [Monosporozyma servazzii]
MSTVIYYHPMFILPNVPMCLAEYFKSDIQNVNISTDRENFARDFPLQKCPSLINRETGLYLTETVSIQHYIIKTFCKDPEEIKKLLGSTILEESQILRWESLSSSNLLMKEAYYIKPLIGMMPYDKDAHAQAKKELDAVVQIFEDHLKNHQFLVSDHITLADLSVTSIFYFGFNFTFDEKWSQQYPNITRWYKEITKSPYVSNFFNDKQQVKVCPQPPK